MPYRSKAQSRLFRAKEARKELPKGTASRWAHHTPNMKKLPEHAKQGALAMLQSIQRVHQELQKCGVSSLPPDKLQLNLQRYLHYQPQQAATVKLAAALGQGTLKQALASAYPDLAAAGHAKQAIALVRGLDQDMQKMALVRALEALRAGSTKQAASGVGEATQLVPALQAFFKAWQKAAAPMPPPMPAGAPPAPAAEPPMDPSMMMASMPPQLAAPPQGAPPPPPQAAPPMQQGMAPPPPGAPMPPPPPGAPPMAAQPVAPHQMLQPGVSPADVLSDGPTGFESPTEEAEFDGAGLGGGELDDEPGQLSGPPL